MSYFHKILKNLKNKHFNINIVKLSLWQVLMNAYVKRKENISIEDIETKINELKRLKHCLEFDLTCNGIINYGPIMKELDKVNAQLKKLEKKYDTYKGID